MDVSDNGIYIQIATLSGEYYNMTNKWIWGYPSLQTNPYGLPSGNLT